MKVSDELLYMLERSVAVKAEDNIEDPWEELLKLAKDDPCVKWAADMVRYRGMSVGEAALHLALAQSKCVAIMRDELIKSRMLAPFALTVPANGVSDRTAVETKLSGC